MKGILLTFAMILSLNSFGTTREEYDENTEKKCHVELKNFGCVKEDKESKSCAELNKNKLSNDCRSLHEAQKRQILQ